MISDLDTFTLYFILSFYSCLFILVATIATQMQVKMKVTWIIQCSAEQCTIPIMEGLLPFSNNRFIMMTQLIRNRQMPCFTN